MAALAELERVVHEQLTGADVDVRASRRRAGHRARARRPATTRRSRWPGVGSRRRTAVPARTRRPRPRHAVRSSMRELPGDTEKKRAPPTRLQQPSLRPDPRRRGARPRAGELLEPRPGRTLEAIVTGAVADCCDARRLRRRTGRVSRARRDARRARARPCPRSADPDRRSTRAACGEPSRPSSRRGRAPRSSARFRSSAVQAPLIAEALHAQGRHDEAEDALAGVTARLRAGDRQWHVRLRIVTGPTCDGARTVPGRGRAGRGAVALADRTEDLSLRGTRWPTLADALSAAGRGDAAAAGEHGARALYEAKGNVARRAGLLTAPCARAGALSVIADRSIVGERGHVAAEGGGGEE